MDLSTKQTATIHRDSPQPTKLRDYEERADQIMATVKKALYDQSMTREHAHGQVELCVLEACGQNDDDPPTKWQLLVDAANAVIDAASMAHSQEQQLRLGNAGLPYLDKLIDHINHEEAKRENDRGLFITAQEIAKPRGVDYLIACFESAMTHNQDIHFEQENQ